MIPAGDDRLSFERPIINQMLIIVNIGIFLLAYFYPSTILPGATSINDIIEVFGVKPYFIVNFERLWTILTAMFIHTSFVHLFGNMLYLYVFGNNVEIAFGKIKYFIFYIISGVGAIVFHIASIIISSYMFPMQTITPYNPWLVSAVGASGAISGVLGAYIILYPRSMIRTIGFWIGFPLVLRVPAVIFIGIWFVYQLTYGLLSLTLLTAEIAFWAHIGGFLTGIAITPIFIDNFKINQIKIIYQNF